MKLLCPETRKLLTQILVNVKSTQHLFPDGVSRLTYPNSLQPRLELHLHNVSTQRAKGANVRAEWLSGSFARKRQVRRAGSLATIHIARSAESYRGRRSSLHSNKMSAKVRNLLRGPNHIIACPHKTADSTHPSPPAPVALSEYEHRS